MASQTLLSHLRSKSVLLFWTQFAWTAEYTNYDLPTNACHRCSIKPSAGEALDLEIWGKLWTLSLPLLPCQLQSRVEAAERVLSMGQIELFDI